MPGIFISHSSRDSASAAELAERLRAQGYRGLFLDFDPVDGIPAGRNWEREIYVRLRACSAVIVLHSRHSAASDWCFAEITHARALGKQLFPLRLDDSPLRPILSDLQVTDLVSDSEAGYRRLWQGLRVAGLDPHDNFDWNADRPPYPGLAAFQVADAAVYFGRGDDRRRCLDALAQMRRYGGDRLLAVIGSSGCGKSSLVRAGVIPRLSRLPGWLVLPPMRPGRKPVDALAHVLPDPVRARFADDDSAQALGRSVTAVAASSSSVHETVAVLLVIDQLEELVTTSDADAAERFVALLCAALAEEDGPLYCLATLRADYLSAVQAQAASVEIRFREISLGPISANDFREIIERPAQIAGIDMEQALVDRLVGDTVSADALPLLAFSLNRLWREFGAEGRFMLDHYSRRIGGLEGAVRDEADAVLNTLGLKPAQRAALRRAFGLMARVDGEGHYTRRSVRWDEIPETARPLMEAFVTARLLVAGREESSSPAEGPTLEVAHEALFRAWPQLQRWLDEDRAFLLWRQHLRADADAWEAAPSESGLLLRGGPLVEAQRWNSERAADLEDRLRDYIRASERAAQRLRRRWRTLQGAVLVALATVSLLGLTLWQQLDATRDSLVASTWSRGIVARDAQDDALTAAHLFARVADSSTDPRTTGNARIALGALVGGVQLTGILVLPASPDGARIRIDSKQLVSWHGRVLAAHDLQGGVTLARTALPANVSAAWPGAQGRVLIRDTDAALWLWRPGQGPPVLLRRDVRDVALSRDGLRGLGFTDAILEVWSLSDGALLGRLAPADRIGGASFIDASSVLIWHHDGRMTRWRIGSGDATSWPSGCRLRGLDIASGGDGALGWCDAALVYNDIAQGRVRTRWQPAGSVDGARLVPGRHLALSWDTAAGQVHLWDVAGGALLVEDPAIRDGSLARVLLSPSGDRFFTSGAGGRVEGWELYESEPAARARHDPSDGKVMIEMSPDGARLLAWSAAGARLWDARTLTPLSLLLRHRGNTLGAAMFDDGRGLVSWSDDAIVRIWRRQPDRELTGPAVPATDATAFGGRTARAEAWLSVQPVLGLSDYRLLDRRDGATLAASGTLARRIVPDATASPPLSLAEAVVGGALLGGGRAVLWGNTSVRLWDGAGGQPLTPLLRSDVLHPEQVVLEDDGLYTVSGGQGRRWRWPAPKTAGPSAQNWVALVSGTWMDAHGAVSVLERDTWCALPGQVHVCGD